MRTALKYTGLVLAVSFVGTFLLFVILFVVGIPVPLPLSQEQHDEIATYAPDKGISVFESTLWKVGTDAQLGVTEIILVGNKRDGQVSVVRYARPFLFWDVTKTVGRYRQKQREEILLKATPRDTI